MHTIKRGSDCGDAKTSKPSQSGLQRNGNLFTKATQKRLSQWGKRCLLIKHFMFSHRGDRPFFPVNLRNLLFSRSSSGVLISSSHRSQTLIFLVAFLCGASIGDFSLSQRKFLSQFSWKKKKNISKFFFDCFHSGFYFSKAWWVVVF